MTIDITKLSKEEREFVTGIINRLDSGDVKNVGTELFFEFKAALTQEVFQKVCLAKMPSALKTLQGSENSASRSRALEV